MKKLLVSLVAFFTVSWPFGALLMAAAPTFVTDYGTTRATWEIGGSAGPQLYDNGGAIEARTAALDSLAIMRGATPVGSNDLATMAYVLAHGGGGGSTPTGTGWQHFTGGAADPAARAVNISSADITGILPIADLAPGTDGQFFVTNATPLPAWVTPTGDVTFTDAGVFHLATVNSNVGTFGSGSLVPGHHGQRQGSHHGGVDGRGAAAARQRPGPASGTTRAARSTQPRAR